MSLELYAQSGMKAIEEQDFSAAIESFKKAIQLDPSRPDMTNALGMAYLYRGEVGTALPLLSQAVALAKPFTQPEHQELKRSFYMSLASAYHMADQYAEAKDTLNEAIALWPKHPEARLQLGALLISGCELDDGRAVYQALLGLKTLDKESKQAIEALLGSIKGFFEAEVEANVFLEAHQASYKEYFDNVAAQQVAAGWYAEAARMSRPEPGEAPKPVLTQGARPYALTRVDLVNPKDGEVGSVYSDTDPMIVAVEKLEPLAQAPVLLPWRGWPFETWVCTQCPWHWLNITVQFSAPTARESRDALVDAIIGEWYLSGYNGDFGESNTGRFHYISDPEFVEPNAISYTVDLGRSKYEAVEALMRRLTVLHDRAPLQRVLFGKAHLPN